MGGIGVKAEPVFAVLEEIEGPIQVVFVLEI
jgi:hypothetical protein